MNTINPRALKCSYLQKITKAQNDEALNFMRDNKILVKEKD
jgi:hypothetical protein